MLSRDSDACFPGFVVHDSNNCICSFINLCASNTVVCRFSDSNDNSENSSKASYIIPGCSTNVHDTSLFANPKNVAFSFASLLLSVEHRIKCLCRLS